MTVPSTTSRNDYLGSGTTGPFPYGFLVYNATHLRVTKQDAAGNVATLAPGADYSVSGVASPAGGAISTTLPLASGEKLTLRRVVPLTQLTDYRNQQGFYAEVVEQNLDLAVQALQQHDDQLARTLQINETEGGFSAALPGAAARAGQLLGFDQLGNPIATGTVAGVLPTALIVQTIDTVAALKAVIAPTAGALYQTRGYYAIGDGGAEQYRWNASDTTPDNGVAIIALNAGGTGRWNLMVSSQLVRALDSIAALKAVTAPAAGSLYQTRGYYTPGDGGAGLYRWNPGDTTTDNGGTVIQLTAGGTGRWLLINGPAPLSVRQFGAKGDGVTDDTGALQAALNASGGAALQVPFGSFKTTNTIVIISGTRLYGMGGSIVATANAPVLASKGWVDASSPTGNTVIDGMKIVCANAGSSQHGIVLRDYYSVVKNCVVVNPGGRGIYLTHLSNNLTSVGGNLVENRILDCTVQLSVGDAYWIGDASNGKITDGFARNLIAYLNSGSTAYGLWVGSAAGWFIDGIHTYGGTPSIAVGIANAFETSVGSLYVEDFATYGVHFPATQQSLTVGSICVKSSSAVAGSSAVGVDKSAAVSVCDVIIGRVSFVYSGSNMINLVKDVNGGASRIYVGNYFIGGPGAGYVVDFYNSGSLPNSYYRANNLQVDGILLGNSIKMELSYLGVKIPETFAIKWNGNGAQNISIPIAYLENYGKRSFIISIDSRSFDNGAITCEFTGKIFLSAKINGSDAWTASLTNLSTPSGFSVNPTISSSFITGNSGNITISFTCSSSSAQGVCGLGNLGKT